MSRRRKSTDAPPTAHAAEQPVLALDEAPARNAAIDDINIKLARALMSSAGNQLGA
jgi:hypothetical protein